MITTILRIAWINFTRDRVAQLMSFVLPVVFFSIFASVFGNQGGNAMPKVTIALADEDGSAASIRLADALSREPSLTVRRTEKREGGAPGPIDRERARALVREGSVPVAVVLPRGLGESIGSFGQAGKGVDGKGTAIELLADPSDPIAPQVVMGLIQKVVMTSLPDLVAERGIAMFDRYGGGLTPEQRKAVDGWLPQLKKRAEPAPRPGGAGSAGISSSSMPGLVPVEVVDVIRAGNPKKGIVAFYAAGIGVMFLLFTAAAAGGALIEEVESGTLERLLSTRLGMGRLLLGKWLYLTLLGSAQLLVMFVFGAIAFGLELVPHLAGFAVMTAVTASASAGFGLLLAALCRSRAQLSGLSTVVILVMSALGGSMFPRFLMSPTMKRLGLFTFNGWALDGYVKVFWRHAPLLQLWPQVLVLAALAAAFLTAARLAARRWESA